MRDRNTGFAGHMTKDRALACLQNCPLLGDLAEWSHWDLIFKPELKDLKDFIQKHGGIHQMNVSGMYATGAKIIHLILGLPLGTSSSMLISH